MTDPIHIYLGPSKSSAMAVVRRDFAAWVTANAGDSLELSFPADQADQVGQLLGLVGRIRKLRVTWRGTSYDRNGFCNLFWQARADREVRQRREAYEAAGSWWSLPDSELISLASATGDWDFEPDEPMAPNERAALLRAFIGDESADDPWVARAMDVIVELGTFEYRRIRSGLETELGVEGWRIEDSIRRAIELSVGVRDHATASADGIVFFQLAPAACVTCRRLHLEEDGTTPRLFLSSELPPALSNASRKLGDWLPARPPLHVGCSCSITPWNEVFALSSAEAGFPERYVPTVTRLPSWSREPLTVVGS